MGPSIQDPSDNDHEEREGDDPHDDLADFRSTMHCERHIRPSSMLIGHAATGVSAVIGAADDVPKMWADSSCRQASICKKVS
jgi:hypothetical protein